MKIKSVKVSKLFVPEWNDNKKLPPNEQVMITFARIPGTAEKNTFMGFKADSQGSIQFVFNDTLLASSLISKIDNLIIEEDGQDKRIRTGQELAQTNSSALADLFTEIRAYLFPEADENEAGESEA
jgi:hypothetical protein